MTSFWPTRCNRRPIGQRNAFTIIESLAALTITGVSVVAVIGALRIASDATDRMRDAHRARLLAERHMVALLQSEHPPASDAHGIEGKFAWEQKVLRGPVRNVTEVRVTVRWAHQGQPRTFELASLKHRAGPGGD